MFCIEGKIQLNALEYQQVYPRVPGKLTFEYQASLPGPRYFTEWLFTERRKTAFWVESPKANGRFTE